MFPQKIQMIKINGARLKRWRDEANYSQEGLGEFVGTSGRTIRNAENSGGINGRLADTICAKLHKSKIDLMRLSPDLRVALLDGASPEQEDLFESALRCHRRLFTGYFADVSREHMRQWL